jgi:uridylate kinase
VYKRILLKLSGEALAGDKGTGIDWDTMNGICDAIKEIHDEGVEIGIVVGGGNFWRGKYGKGMVKTTADYMGMLATTMNGLALQDALEKRGLQTRVQTAIEMRQIAEPYIGRRALRHLEKGRIVIFSCGTGSPYFSTDTAASLRACEIQANVILVAKTIDGVYNADPKVDPNAKKFDHITYQQIIEEDLKVMDSTSISLCKDNNIPLVVFAMKDPKNIIRATNGEEIGTKVDNVE